jgi:hypothetical protein
VSILQRQSVIRIPRQLDALLVVGVTLLCTAAPVVPSNAAIAVASGIVALAVLAWYKRCPAAAPFSIFCVICLGLIFSGVRYFPVILALGLLGYAGVVRGVPWLRGTATWARWGSFDAGVCLLSVGASLLAAVALLSWYLLLHPNIADIVEAYVPALPLGLLIGGGLFLPCSTQLSKKPRIAVCSCTRWIGHSDPDSRLFCCKPLPSGRFISEDFRAVGPALAWLVSSGCSWGSFGDALAACSLLG